jgi:hypothetical protein
MRPPVGEIGDGPRRVKHLAASSRFARLEQQDAAFVTGYGHLNASDLSRAIAGASLHYTAEVDERCTAHLAGPQARSTR